MTKTITAQKGQTQSPKNDTNVDLREALFNDGKIGPIQAVQVSTECIVRLNGIMFDIDPPLLRTSPILPEVPQDAQGLYDRTVRHWLSRHPVLDKAEVRATGGGLHVLLWLDTPIEFQSDRERDRWVALVQIAQAALPIDPNQPGITATTRPVGSINSKTGKQVCQLKPGLPVSAAEVEEFCRQIVERPFETVISIVHGSTKVISCPFCQAPDKPLSAQTHGGFCYGCGKHNLSDLYRLLLRDRKEVTGDLGRAA